MFKRHSADQRERRDAGNYLLLLAATIGLTFLFVTMYGFSWTLPTLFGYQHFALWDFWCGPNSTGHSVARLISHIFGLGLILLLVWILIQPVNRRASVVIFVLELLLAFVIVGHLYANGQFLSSGHCRAVNDRAYEQALGAVWGESWTRPPGKVSKYCHHYLGFDCWKDVEAPPFVNPNIYTAEDRADRARRLPFKDATDAEIADEVQRCLDEIRISRRPRRVVFESAFDPYLAQSEFNPNSTPSLATKYYPHIPVRRFSSELIDGILVYRDDFAGSIIVPATQSSVYPPGQMFYIADYMSAPSFECRFVGQKYASAHQWNIDWLDRREEIARENLNNRLRLRTSH